MTAEDKISRAFLILISVSLVAAATAIGLVVWVFLNIASHF